MTTLHWVLIYVAIIANVSWFNKRLRPSKMVNSGTICQVSYTFYAKSRFYKILEIDVLASVRDECTVDGKTTAAPHAVVGGISSKHENGCQVTWLHWRKHKNENSNRDITVRVVRYRLDEPEITSLVCICRRMWYQWAAKRIIGLFAL